MRNAVFICVVGLEKDVTLLFVVWAHKPPSVSSNGRGAVHCFPQKALGSDEYNVNDSFYRGVCYESVVHYCMSEGLHRPS